MFGKSGRTHDAQNAIVDVDASPARTYATKQEASAAVKNNVSRAEAMVDRVMADRNDGGGVYESHT